MTDDVRARARRRLGAFVLVALVAILAAAVSDVVREPSDPESSPLIINDITRLNPIAVSAVIVPTSIEEIVGTLV